MKPFALLNSLLAFFGGVAVGIALHLYRDPCDYILVSHAREYTMTYASVLVDGMVMLALAGLGSCAALQPNLKRRRVMLILYAAMMCVLLLGEVILGLWLVLRANWALSHLSPNPIDPKLKQFLEELSLGAGVNQVVVAWLGALLLLQVGVSAMAGFEAHRAKYKLRLRHRLAKDEELKCLSFS